jgi:hypothetical protein
MSKKVKPGVDVRAPNPTNTKRMGRSQGALVYNEIVGVMVTPKKDRAIRNNRQRK